MRAAPRSRSLCARARPRGGRRRRRLPVVADDPAVRAAPAGRRARRSTMNAAIGEREGAWIVATGAQRRSRPRSTASALGPLKAALYFGHFVSFGGRAVPDALLPWNGAAPGDRAAEPADLPPGRSSRRTRSPAATGRPCTSRPTAKPTDGPGDDHRLRRPAARAGRGQGQPPHRLPRHARVVREQGRPALPPRLERGPRRGERRRSSRSSPRYRISPGGLGVRRAAHDVRLHLLAEVVARRRREHGPPEPERRSPRCGSRSRTSGRARRTGSPVSRRSQPDTWCDYLQSVRELLGRARLARRARSRTCTRSTSRASRG